MALVLSVIVQVGLIVLIISVSTTYVDCRSGGHGRGGHGRLSSSNLFKKKFHSNTIARQSSVLRKSNNHMSVPRVAGGAAAFIVGTLALRSYVLNNEKALVQYRRGIITNGTGNLCTNRENFSNFVFNEFRCPLSPIFTTNDRYCCGLLHQQYCCSFWASNGRAAGAITGIISACGLVVLFFICCIVYYRRHLKRKGINDPNISEQPVVAKRSANSIPSESPPPYSEAVRFLAES